jgi:hypothetical protein
MSARSSGPELVEKLAYALETVVLLGVVLRRYPLQNRRFRYDEAAPPARLTALKRNGDVHRNAIHPRREARSPVESLVLSARAGRSSLA